jgi:hypothetical protein
VATLRPQTYICAEIDDGTDLHELLERCSGMGLRLISVRRLSSTSDQRDEASTAAANWADRPSGR